MLLYSVAREQSGTGETAGGERARQRKTVKVMGRRFFESFAKRSRLIRRRLSIPLPRAATGSEESTKMMIITTRNLYLGIEENYQQERANQ